MKADYKRKATLVHIVFQLTIFVIFMKAKATADMVEGCIESQLILSCDERKVINISSVVLGDSPCIAIFTSCCPKNDSCTQKPNDNHVTDVHRRCNGQKRCTVNVIKEGISCQTTTFYGNQYNDFERITYDCIDNGKMVEGCTESQLTLSCDETKVINISSVVLGDSWCTGTSCCPKPYSCTAKPDDSHVYDVHRRCNGRPRCTVNVFKKRIPCGTTWLYTENNDFERIVYDCIDNGIADSIHIHTTMANGRTTENERDTTSTDEAIESNDSKTRIANCSSETMLKSPIIMGCLMAVLVIIIVVLITIICKRKKRQIETDSSGVKLSVVPNVNNEARYSEDEIDNRLYAELVKPGPEDYSRTYDRLAT